MRNRKTFGDILETLGVPGAARRRNDGGFANPLATAAAPIASEGGDDPGSENLWDHAFAWALDASPDPAPSDPRVPAPSDDPEAIAAELGLASASTRDALHRARRRFMWRNHPDRARNIPTDLANRRVAIANMLIDRALAPLRGGG